MYMKVSLSSGKYSNF